MKRRPLCFVLVGLIFIQALLTKGGLIGYDQAFSFLSEDKEYVAEATGVVYKKEQNQKYQVLYLKNSQIILNNKSINRSKIQVRIATKDQIVIGNQIKVQGKATGFQSARNPGNFDLKKYYATRGIYIQLKADYVKILDNKVCFVKEILYKLRATWKNFLFCKMGDHYGSIMTAMLTGEKSELDEETSKLYKQVGISHILAISGLHMSFIGFGIYKLLRKIGKSFVIAGGESFLFLLAYTLLSGCGVSSVRALLMFVIRMGAEITGRDYDMVTSMIMSAFLMCLWSPLYVTDEGFLLSYGAVFGISVVVPSIQTYFQPKNKLSKSIISGIGIQITLLPILLYFYFELSIYSILVNSIILPGMSIVLGSGIIGSCVGIFWESGTEIAFGVCKFMLWWYEMLAKLVRNFPKSIVITGKPAFLGICFYYGLLCLFCYVIVLLDERQLRLKNKKMIVPLVFVLIGVMTLSCVLPQRTRELLSVTMLDVGQGDGLYIKTPDGGNLFVDGGSSNVTNVGEQRIAPFLKSKGVQRLDYVMISHSDSDHKNGIEELLEDQKYGIKINTLLLPPRKVWDEGFEKLALLATSNGTKVQIFEEGQTMKEGVLYIKCLAPGKQYNGKTGNEASMVFELNYLEFRMLFTGDLEGTGERELEKSGKLKKCSVLKVAHHGSKNSTSETFMEETRPAIAFISSGINNRYGHPDKETLEKLKKYGCIIFQTKKKGAITLQTDGYDTQIYENLE